MARVLVLDNDTALSMLVGHYLRSVGHSVTIAGNALESLMWLNLESFDLVVVDLVQEPGDRLDLCRKLKRYSQNANTQLLVLSGAGELESRALAAGADAFLPKPLHLQAIRDCVLSLTSRLDSLATLASASRLLGPTPSSALSLSLAPEVPGACSLVGPS